MAEYFPRTSPTLSPRLSKPTDVDSLVSSARSNRSSVSPRSPTLSSQRSSNALSPRSPTLLSQRASNTLNTVKRVGKKMVHDKIESNDWNLVLDDVLHHLKKHGVTTKLIEMLQEHHWETVHHVLRRALLISAIRWDVKHVMSLFILMEHLKSRFGNELEEVKEDLKNKVRELVNEEHVLEQLREYLM